MIVLITGGIGSGKSVVSRILTAMGLEVYDCDSRARRLMESSLEIKTALCERIHPEAVTIDGKINRSLIAQLVFGNDELRLTLNNIVHGAVTDDIHRRHRDCALLFVESAIPDSSGLVNIADRIIEVKADHEVRIQRVISRNGMSRAEVEARIKAQSAEVLPESVDRFIIYNSNDCTCDYGHGPQGILARINDFLSSLSHKA